MKLKTLYVTDLDGTLLGADSRLSPETVRMLNILAGAGVAVTPATARTPATVQQIFASVRQPECLDAEGKKVAVPSIVMTGAGLWDRGKVCFERCTLIPEEDAVRIRDIFEREALRPFVYCLSGDRFLNVYHSESMSRREDSFYQERRHLTLKRFHLGQRPARWDSVALFFAIGPVRIVEETTRELSGVTACAAAWYPDINMPDTGLIDLYAPGVSKAGAVRELAAALGAERIVVFGDNLNDLPMMRVADVAVAVENALPEVKEAADVVIGPNTADAVPRFIMQQEGI